MAEQDYARKYVELCMAGKYEEAHTISLEHGDDLTARLEIEDVAQVFTELKVSGRVDEAEELYNSAQRIGRREAVKAIEQEILLLDLGSAKKRMIAKKN